MIVRKIRLDHCRRLSAMSMIACTTISCSLANLRSSHWRSFVNRLVTEQVKTLFPLLESVFRKASFPIRSLVTVSTDHLRCFLSSPRVIGEVFFPKINSRARMVELTDQWQFSDNWWIDEHNCLQRMKDERRAFRSSDQADRDWIEPRATFDQWTESHAKASRTKYRKQPGNSSTGFGWPVARLIYRITSRRQAIASTRDEVN